MTTAECVAWFEEQCERHRRILQITVLVPNADTCAYFVQEWEFNLQEWQNIGDGFSLVEAINEAAGIKP